MRALLDANAHRSERLFAESVKRIVIIGGGLIGGSLAEAIPAAGMTASLRLIDTDSVTREAAIASGLFQGGVFASLDETLPESKTLIVLACPLGAYENALRDVGRLYGALSGGDVYLTDAGSVKTYVREAFRTCVPSLLNDAVGAHPIAGTERAGFAAREAGLFAGKRTILCPGPTVSKRALEIIGAFWAKISGNVTQTDGETHDRIYARASHLPQLLAFGLKIFLREEGLSPLYAAKKRPFARLFDSPPSIWRDIFRFNVREVSAALAEYRAFGAGKSAEEAVARLKPLLYSMPYLPNVSPPPSFCSTFEFLYWGSLPAAIAPYVSHGGSALRDCASLPIACARYDNAPIEDRLPPADSVSKAIDCAAELLDAATDSQAFKTLTGS
ncbi:MAG: prephenate dehydrogenase/arogenate dehydrogenase family protein [Rickettsiales bacterium]